CFLDKDRYQAGDDWKKVGRWTLRRTTKLILVGSPESLRSRPVLEEVSFYRRLNKSIVPIDFDGSLDPEKSTSKLFDYVPEEIIRLCEKGDRLELGPSQSVLERLRVDFRAVRQTQRRLRILAGAAAIFAVVAAIAVWMFLVANKERRFAESQLRYASSQRIGMESSKLLLSDTPLATLLAVEAFQVLDTSDVPPPAARQALRDALGEVTVSKPRDVGAPFDKAAFSPDSRLLWAGASDGTVRVFDLLEKGEEFFQQLLEPGVPVESLSIDPTGRWLGVRLRDGTIVLWDLETKERATYSGPHPEGATVTGGLAVGPNGTFFITVTQDGPVRLWRLAEDESGIQPIELAGIGPRPYVLTVDPTGRFIALGYRHGDVKFIELTAELLARHTDEWIGLGEPVVALAFDHTGRFLAIGTTNGKLTIYKIDADGRHRHDRDLNGLTDDVEAIDFSPDGRYLAAGSQAGWACRWDLTAESASAPSFVLPCNELPVKAVTVDDQGNLIAATSGDGRGELFGLDPVEQLGSTAVALTIDEVSSIAFDPSGRFLVARPKERGDLILVDLERGNSHKPVSVTDSGSRVAASFDHSGRLLVAVYETLDDTIRIHRIHTNGKPGADPLGLPFDGSISVSAFSREGGFFAAASERGIVRTWDLSAADVRESMRELPEQDDNATAICFGARGQLLALGYWKTGVSFWEMSDDGTWHETLDLPYARDVEYIALDPTGRYLATGTAHGIACLWDLQARNVEESMQELAEHRRENVSLAFPPQVVPVEFCPHGRFIITGSYEGVPRLWDLQAADVTTSSVALRGHRESVTAVAFDPTARLVATASRYGTIRIWTLQDSDLLDLARQYVTRELDAWERARYVTGSSKSDGM
ncbi:MAG: WD40 repeat domain-containing protein, partial [Planctomycetota bacterium]